jgi:hypothetical protein
MNKAFDKDARLISAIRQLPRGMRPGRDLWPGIASRLAPATNDRARVAGRRWWRSGALAASLAVAVAVGMLLGRQQGSSVPESGDGAAYGLPLQVALEVGEREYQAAFREFLPVTGAGPLLALEALENVESSWVELRQVESALQAALHEYPEDAYLNRKLLDLRAQQLGFMKQMAVLDQYSRRRI